MVKNFYQLRLNPQHPGTNFLKSSSILASGLVKIGESFYFNFYEYADNECPIYIRTGNSEPNFYAHDFYEFLYKIINECIEN